MTDARRMEKNAYSRAWRVEHREEIRVKNHAAYLENREEAKSRSRAHYATHKEEARAWGVTYRATHRVERIAYDVAHPERRAAATAYGKAWMAERPEQARAFFRKHAAKRRVLGFVPMNQPFIGCEGHHLNQSDVIYIPKALHRSIAHNVWTGRNMEQMNALASNWMTEDWT